MHSLIKIRSLLCTIPLLIYVAVILFTKLWNKNWASSLFYQTDNNIAWIDPRLIPTICNQPRPKIPRGTRFNQSALAHNLLDGLKGIEIGASLHNPFGLDTLNVDYSDDVIGFYQKSQNEASGSAAKIHVKSFGDKLPFTNESFDFVINSHVLEHFYDPIKAIQEWLRVVKKGGYVFMIIPHAERTFERARARTTLAELLQRHRGQRRPAQLRERVPVCHKSVWVPMDMLELCRYFGWQVAEWHDKDDKVGNGFTVVLRK